MGVSIPESRSILGTRVSIFNSYEDALELIRQRIITSLPTFCVAVNPEKLYRAKGYPELRKVLDAADLRICDGIGVSLASMLLYHRRLPRCTGIELFLRLIRLSAQEGWKVFVLGASPQSNEAACRALMERFPGLSIAGRRDGYFENSEAVVESINESGADLLFVAMGSPRQEFWISEHMPRLKTSYCMGVGGSLDVVSGTAKRAPILFQRTGTEWLFRLISQPSRLRRHVALPLFTMEILRAMRNMQ
jgi:N-acetylglucosaminyldiphosphoundecaprenol N-acetyl-beta-D-mannosaminyltransferase